MSLLILALLLAAPADEARDHYKKGQTHYSLGEFEEAVKEFREAYRLKQEPGLLFNVAQSYRQLHQWEQARFNYRQYLNLKPDAPNRAEVEELIDQMQRRVDEEREQATRVARDKAAARNTEALLPAPHQPVPQPAVAPPPPEPHAARWAGYAALGAGAVAEGVALLMHGSAQSAADTFNQKYAAGTLTTADASLRDDAQSRGKLATAALAGGAVLLVTGAVLVIAF
ncbi:MAG TPA: tetratricopeptide repeat protein [Myxococcales bacterium]|nr:tetratricopeptide repeat protein [Myxococcales bacterium]